MSFKVPIPNTQISFYKKLEVLKETHLQEALLKTVRKASITDIDSQLAKFVQISDLQIMASSGLRGEVAFPVPYLLELNPFLIGYYRLLLGLPQKSFYSNGKGGLGFGMFRAMETKGIISLKQKIRLDDLCKTLIGSSSILVKTIDKSSLSKSLFRDLTLLTLGAQLRGGRNNELGTSATKKIFNIIKGIVRKAIIKSSNDKLLLRNASKRQILIQFSSDPDIVILEKLNSGDVKNRIAIEIKGGSDISNAHNRLGEAEKSHQKAKNEGFIEFWTLVGAKIDLDTAKKESPTTDEFFYIPHLMDKTTVEFQKFKDQLIAMVGIED